MLRTIQQWQSIKESYQFKNSRLRLNLAAWGFWITFVLSYLISRPLIIATNGVYRAGVVAIALATLLILTRLVLLNRHLLFGVTALGSVIFLSAIINQSSLNQLVLFFRIPFTAYLVYYLVAVYLNNKQRVIKVLRIMYIIAVIQLPVLILQRITYPILPDRLKFGSLTGHLSAADFGMGTFNGDAVMSFFLVSLLIVLLFWDGSKGIVKRKWFVAVWITLTVLVANSQIQHFLVMGIWSIYIISHLRIKTILTLSLGLVILGAALVYFDRTGILTFSPVRHTLSRASLLFSETDRQERIEQFLAGGHARDGAILYYLQEPINWIGDGPGKYLNSVTRERTRNWGHIFTFYSEVGLIGWLLSMIIFFLIAFPISAKTTRFRLRVSWVQFMMFLSIVVVSVARYPMNTIGFIFTYCVILIGYRFLDKPRYLRFA